MFRAIGEPLAAEPLYRDALAIKRKLFGDNHPAVANGLNNLGLFLKQQGLYLNAEQHYREALNIYRRTCSAPGVETLAVCSEILTLYCHSRSGFLTALSL